MSEENKVLLSDFVQEDRFELNSYLTYLFNQFNVVSSTKLANDIHA